MEIRLGLLAGKWCKYTAAKRDAGPTYRDVTHKARKNIKR